MKGKISFCGFVLASTLLMIERVAAFDRQALASWFTGLRTEKVVHAINCGSYEDVTDLLGVTYKAVSLTKKLIINRIMASQAVLLPMMAPKLNGPSLTLMSITVSVMVEMTASGMLFPSRVMVCTPWSLNSLKSTSKNLDKRSSM